MARVSAAAKRLRCHGCASVPGRTVRTVLQQTGRHTRELRDVIVRQRLCGRPNDVGTQPVIDRAVEPIGPTGMVPRDPNGDSIGFGAAHQFLSESGLPGARLPANVDDVGGTFAGISKRFVEQLTLRASADEGDLGRRWFFVAGRRPQLRREFLGRRGWSQADVTERFDAGMPRSERRGPVAIVSKQANQASVDCLARRIVPARLPQHTNRAPSVIGVFENPRQVVSDLGGQAPESLSRLKDPFSPARWRKLTPEQSERVLEGVPLRGVIQLAVGDEGRDLLEVRHVDGDVGGDADARGADLENSVRPIRPPKPVE